MTIEWEKIKNSPDSEYKVEGNRLLDLKAKIDDVETLFLRNKTETEDIKNNLEQIEKELADLKETLAQTIQQLEERLF